MASEYAVSNRALRDPGCASRPRPHLVSDLGVLACYGRPTVPALKLGSARSLCDWLRLIPGRSSQLLP